MHYWRSKLKVTDSLMCVQLHDTFFKEEILQAHVGISGEKNMGGIEKRKDIAMLLFMSKKQRNT